MKIKVKVKPNSLKEEMKKIGAEEYLVNIKKPAIDGKANLAMLKLLKKHFKREVKITSGFKSRNKIVEITEKSRNL